MLKLTVRKSSRPPKPTRSHTMPSKSTSSSSSKPKVKCVKISGFIHPDDKHVVEDENDLEQEEDIQEVRRAVKDVSLEIFTLKYSCLLRSDIVYEDTDYVCLEEFSYRQFTTQGIRKLDKVAEEAKVDFGWV